MVNKGVKTICRLNFEHNFLFRHLISRWKGGEKIPVVMTLDVKVCTLG
jgi:hypothetical protein